MPVHNKIPLLTLPALLAAMPGAWAAPDFHPGLWETTIKMHMQGAPITIAPVTTRQCITPKKMVPNTSQPGQNCTIKNQNISGNSVSWNVECAGSHGTLQGRGQVTYAGNSYHGTMDMRMTNAAGGPPMTMSYTIDGRRVGACR